MSAHQKGPKAVPVKVGQSSWQDFLDFGDSPDNSQKPQDEVSRRLKNLVQQLQEINRRIDNLNKPY
jgi:hypothetical protein